MSSELETTYQKLWDEYKLIPKEDFEKRKAHMAKINEVGKDLGKKEYTVKGSDNNSGSFRKFTPRTTEQKVQDAEAYMKILKDNNLIKDIEANQLSINLVHVFNGKA